MKAIVFEDDVVRARSSTSIEIPAELADEAKAARDKMIEAVAEIDDALMERYLNGDTELQRRRDHPRAAQGHARASSWSPWCAAPRSRTRACSSCSTPSSTTCRRRSTSRRSRASTRTTGQRRTSARPTDDAPFSALAFKIINDPFVGQLTFLRVYSGQLDERHRACSTATKDKRERIGRLLLMHANKREEIKDIQAGNICAAVGLQAPRTTGDTLCDEKHADRARAHGVPGAGHLGRDRAEDQGRAAEARRGAAEADRPKIRRSACTPTKRPARPSSAAWASCTSRSSSTACGASSRSSATSASPRSRTARSISKTGQGKRASTSSSPAATACTATSGSRSGRASPARASCSRTTSSAA